MRNQIQSVQVESVESQVHFPEPRRFEHMGDPSLIFFPVDSTPGARPFTPSTDFFHVLKKPGFLWKILTLS